MTSEARTPGVSPAQIPKEWPACPGCEEKELYCAAIHHPDFKHTVDCLLSCYVCTTRISYRNLEKLRREAQVEALESVAKEECYECRTAWPTNLEGQALWWWHPESASALLRPCHAPKIHDALSRLRQSVSAPDER